MHRPVVGITADLIDHNGFVRAAAPRTYVQAVLEAEGVPLILPPAAGVATDQLSRCDALVLTGGDDPIMEPFGVETDARVTRVDPERQAAESFILDFLAAERPDMPVLGVCLGMQMMALHAGGVLDQWMPDTTPTHADHWDRPHRVVSEDERLLATGDVLSRHRQAISAAGSMRVVGRAHDGIIEAVTDPDRPYYLGVQWHPERTADAGLGADLFTRLVASAR